MTVDKLTHSLNINLDEKVVGLVNDVREKLSPKHTGNPHLSIATKFLDREKSSNFVIACLKEFLLEKPFEVTFSKFSMFKNSDEKYSYIFLMPDEKSSELLDSMNKRAIRILKRIGTEGIDSSKPKYPFEPHISVARIPTKKAGSILKDLEKDPKKIRLTVKGLEITREKSVNKTVSEFPVLKKFHFLG